MGVILSKHPKFKSLRSERNAGESETWEKMLPELLALVSDCLPLRDFLTFRRVCRHWRSVPSFRSEITNFKKETLWLMLRNDPKSYEFYIYSPSHPNCCILNLPQLQGATIMASKSSWLIAHRSDDSFFLFNIFTLVEISLPKHTLASNDQSCTFTSLPTSRNCRVFVLTRKSDSIMEMSSCRVGEKKWQVHVMKISKESFGTIRAIAWWDLVGERGVRIKWIGIYSLKKVFNYFSETKSYSAVISRGQNVNGLIPSPCFTDLIFMHREDWLHRFGKTGFSLSLSSTCYGTNAGLIKYTWRVHPTTYTAKSDYNLEWESVPALDQVNATWVMP